MPAGPWRSTQGVAGGAVLFSCCAAALIGSHLPYLGLPYFWDEAGQFVPQAVDLLNRGALVTHSALPNIHPPLVEAGVAAVWKVAGFHPWVSRTTMLLAASGGLAAAFLLAKELARSLRTAALAAALLLVSPLFFAQSMLVQLDAPAMTMTSFALLFFLRGQVKLSAAACVVLVLVKETGLVIPAVLAFLLAAERRWKDALLFVLPGAALLAWIVFLWREAGFWAGNRDFLEYNLYYPLNPLRLALAAFRRVYFLFFADLRWIGWTAAVYGWRRGLFRTRGWKVVFAASAAQVALVTVLGGAVLERYLLPVMPVVYAAIATALEALPRKAEIAAAAALFTGLFINNLVNPPYPFPYENNLAFVDFLRLQSAAAGYLESRDLRAGIYTVWPLSAELARPSLGFVARPMQVRTLAGFSSPELRRLPWRKVRVLVGYSRDWRPTPNLIEWRILRTLYQRCCGYTTPPDPRELRAAVPFPPCKRFTLGGQWVEIYVNPSPE
jgi:Dolichyl-phosphate-mannose-protein mannosyltransferase